jgi:hypothetical protein
MAFIMRGIPVLNVNEKPRELICDAVSFRDKSVLRDWDEAPKPIISPHDFLNEVAQSSFTRKDFQDGTFSKALKWTIFQEKLTAYYMRNKVNPQPAKFEIYRDRNWKEIPEKRVCMEACEKFTRSRSSAEWTYEIVDYGRPFVKCDIAFVWGMAEYNCGHKSRNMYKGTSRISKTLTGASWSALNWVSLTEKKNFSVGLNDIVGYGEYPPGEVDGKDTQRSDPLPREIPNTPIPRNKHSQGPSNVVLICGQIPYDMQIRTDYYKWLSNTATTLKRVTAKRVVFRMHPMLIKPKVVQKLTDHVKSLGLETSSIKDFSDDVRRAHAVVAYKSNSLLEAVCLGVPAFSKGKGSVVKDLCNSDIEKIDDPWFPSQSEICDVVAIISHIQWTVPEIESGEAFKNIIEFWRKLHPRGVSTP